MSDGFATVLILDLDSIFFYESHGTVSPTFYNTIAFWNRIMTVGIRVTDDRKSAAFILYIVSCCGCSFVFIRSLFRVAIRSEFGRDHYNDIVRVVTCGMCHEEKKVVTEKKKEEENENDQYGRVHKCHHSRDTLMKH